MKIQCCNHSGRCSYLNSSEKEGCIWTHSWIHILWISYHILHCEPTIPAFKSLFKPTKLPISRPNGDKARVKNLKNSFPIILLPIIIVANHSSQPAPLHGSITTRYCSLHIANAYDKKVRIQHRIHPPCFNLRIRYTSFMYLGHRALGERERERVRWMIITHLRQPSASLSLEKEHQLAAGGPLLVSDVVGWWRMVSVVCAPLAVIQYG